MLFSRMNLVRSRINYFNNLGFRVSGYISIQYFIASKQSLCGILECCASISNNANMLCLGMVFERIFYVVSLK